MSKTTLFICKSCHHSEERPKAQPADGALLINQVQTLISEKPITNDLEIQEVGCL